MYVIPASTPHLHLDEVNTAESCPSPSCHIQCDFDSRHLPLGPVLQLALAPAAFILVLLFVSPWPANQK